MTHGRKPRKPRPVTSNPILTAMVGASKLTDDDVKRLYVPAEVALAGLKTHEGDAERHWRKLADVFNMVEAMSGLGIASDPDSIARYRLAQEAIGNLLIRRRETGSWTLRAQEIIAIEEGIWLFGVQLEHVSSSEWNRAGIIVMNKISAALAGNAGKDVRVF